MDDDQLAGKKLQQDRVAEIVVGVLSIIAGVAIAAYAYFRITDSALWYSAMGTGSMFIAVGASVLWSGIRS